jgi:hypothetical protein
MSNPSTIKSLFESCTYRNHTVRCPHKELPATIFVAKWRLSDGRWSSWTVIDCPLLPSGLMDCGMTCLSQLVEIEK